MNRISIIIFISLLTIIHSAYNPIPIGAVIVATMNNVFVMQPKEYGGTDELTTIFTAPNGTIIVNTVYDPTPRDLYILYTNGTSSALYLCRLAAVERLDTTIYQLPITFDTANINKFNTFTSDVTNRRVFLTDQTGAVTLFSMSGLMQVNITTAPDITNTIRSVAYTTALNRLFVITDTTVNSCTNLDTNNLQCCQASPQANKLRSIAFDQILADTYVYVLDEAAGIYQVILDSTSGCPTALRAINTLPSYSNLQFVIDRGLYFASGSPLDGVDNSVLLIANQTQAPRSIAIKASIVALHISYPVTRPTVSSQNSCFHGITYSTYRAAVILAAIFGTIMGIFMCFNALFCIDFFMTKRIIRNLKQQIPHNLLEDRWNKLVEEKYAKIALEQQRKKDDPPPRRKSSIGRKTSSAATAGGSNTDNNQTSTSNTNTGDSLQVPKPISNISAYLRRKSESYISRRRSDDYRTQRNQELTDPRRYPATTTQAHIEPLHEVNETAHGLRQNLSRRELLKDDEDFL